jgi:hypothetical protein
MEDTKQPMNQFKATGFRRGKETQGEAFISIQPAFRTAGEHGAFSQSCFYMPPTEARLLAIELNRAADYADQPAITDPGDAIDAATHRVELLTNEE